MEATVNTKLFTAALKRLSTGMARRNRLPVLDNVLIQVVGTALRLVVHNLMDDLGNSKLTCIIPCMMVVLDEELQGTTVNLKTLLAALPSPKTSPTVTIQVLNKFRPLTITTATGATSSLATIPADDFPPGIERPAGFQVWDTSKLDDFRIALSQVAVATSTDQARPVLTYVHSTGQYLEAADGFRAHRSPCLTLSKSALIPTALVKPILAASDDPANNSGFTGFIIGKDKTYFAYQEDSGFMAESEVYNTQYPDLDQVIPYSLPHTIEISDVQAWIAALDQAIKVSKNDIMAVKLTINGKVMLEAPKKRYSTELPAAEIKLDNGVCDPIGFSPRFLKDTLAAAIKDTENKTVTLKLKTPTIPFVVQTPSGFNAVIMPIYMDIRWYE